MLGTVRFLLAVLVVMNHVWMPTANQVGAHAVIAFYIVSGYLMTKVTQEVYGLGVFNSARFLMNRFLRIYPGYWLYAALTAAGLLLLPQYYANVYSSMQMPQSVAEMLRSITLVDLPAAKKLFVPQAWSLWIEVIFYVAFAVGISANRAITAIWLGVSLIVAVYLLWTGAPFYMRYSPFYSASLYFAVGAAIHHFPRIRTITVPRKLWWPLLALFAGWPLLVQWLGFDRLTTGYYPAAVLFIPIMTTALVMKKTSVDTMLGDMTYPVFLCHFFAAGVVQMLTANRVAGYTLTHFLLSLAVSIIFAMLHIRYFDPGISAIRDRIRSRSRIEAQTEAIKVQP